ncbi:MAG: alpha-amylase [SAR324 cluster bacterium]|uniref:Alpha-amylase n=1 Tax=SAR324 cluster bacterium TaxID=2024889 RepID=A0A7X9FQC0_9DELT|nr:alpha-amylase [SAR324 cluster bacterium]
MLTNYPEWVSDAVFYLIFPDRFAKSPRLPKPTNLENWDSPPTLFGFKGGDLYGILEKIDYIQDLGVNTLLLNPIFTSAANHRYHTIDYFSVDPILGGTQALRELVDTLHSRGMRIVLDGVFNHTGRGFYQFNHTLENGAASPYVDWFHFNQAWLKEGRQIDAYPKNFIPLEAGDGSLCLENFGYKGWWNLPALPKLNTDNKDVRKFLLDVAKYWIDFGIDGWRLDVPSEINDPSFWQEFRNVVKNANPEAYIVGEIWEDATPWLHGDQFDAVMNYPFTKSLVSFIPQKSFMEAEVAATGGYKGVKPFKAPEFGAALNKLLGSYSKEVNLVQLNLIGSHDTPRFLNCAGGDHKALMLAALFMCAFPGVPCVYYGDEIGLSGSADPDCRKSFPWEEYKWNREVLNSFKDSIMLRKKESAIRHGSFIELLADGEIYAFARKYNNEVVIFVFNTDSNPKNLASLTIPINGLTQIRELSSDHTIALKEGALNEVSLPPRSAKVFKAIK